MSFGFSIGNFLTIATIIKDIIKYLKIRSGNAQVVIRIKVKLSYIDY